MCIGRPMQVIENAAGCALCAADGQQRRIDTMLVGEQPVGTWLLTFLDTAREVLTPERAVQIREALQAVDLVMRGTMQGDGELDHLFGDLVGREPQLPEFLRKPTEETTTGD